jgi:PAS domain S-box-containing protein
MPETKVILLVEDEYLIGISEKRLLEKEGYQVIHVGDGEKAVNLICVENTHIDLVLMDINLGHGRIDGTQAARQILSQHDVPIVFLSSHSEKEIVEKAEAIASYGYVVKNSSPTVLFASIKMAFRLYEAHLQLRNSEKNLRDAQHLTHTGSWNWVVATDTVTWSEELYRINRRDPALPAPSYSELSTYYTPESWEKLSASVSRALTSGEPYSLELDIVLPDGSITHTLAQGETEVNASGQVVGLRGTVQDTTEMKKTKTALLKSETSFQSIFEKTSAGYVLMAPDGQLLNVNPALAEMLGYTVEELRQSNFRDITHPDDIALSMESLRSLLAGERDTYRFEKRYIHRNGKVVWAFVNTALVRDPQGQPEHFVTSIIDITDRKQVEERLRENKALLQEAQQLAHLGHWQWNVQTGELAWSDEIFRIVGMDRGKFIVTAESFEKLIHPDDLARFLECREQMLERGADVEIDHRIVRPGGEIRHVIERARVLRNDAGQPLFIIGTVQDVTERVLIEQVRKEADQRYYQMFMEHSAVMLLIDPDDGAIVQANLAAAQFYGYPIEMLQSMNIRQINLFSVEHIQAEMKAACERQRNYFTFQHRLSSGQICDVEVYSTPLQVGARKLLYSIIQDISARKKAERSLVKEREKLENIIRGTNVGTWEWNVQTGETTFNSRWAESIGYSLEEISPTTIDTWVRFVHPDDLIKSGEILEKHFSGDVDHYECEVRMLHKSGKWIWVLDRGKVATWDENGKPLLMFGTHQDITERKWIEQALRQGENNFSTFFDSVGDLLFVLGADGNILKANATACKRLKYTEQELVGQHVLQVHPPQRRAEAGQIVADMLAGRRKECPVPLMDRDGNLIEVETYITPGKWNGQDALFGVTKDITELKRSEEKFAKAFRMNSSLMAISTLEDGKYVDVNDAFCDRLGYKKEDVIGKTAVELHLFEDSLQRANMLALIKHQGCLKNLEFKLHTRDGRELEGLFSAEPIEYNGKPHLLTMFFDVTDLKRIERELQQQRDFATQIINVMGQGLTVTNEDGCFEYVNPAYAQLFGYDTADLIGKRPADVTVASERDELANQRRLRRAGQASSYESRLQRADGSIAQVLITAVPRSHGEHYTGAIAVITDLTEQKNNEEQIKHLLAEKEVLLKEVHHRIKNNMTTITSLLNLQASIHEDPATQMALQDASGRVRSMMVLYDKLYRSQDFSAVLLSEYIPVLLMEVMALFPKRASIEVKTDVDEISLAPKFLSPLGIILNELTTNAMKYAFIKQDDGEISISAKQKADRVSIVFADNGSGLPASFTIKDSPGFGMQLVSMLVQQINGRITFDSMGGTRFMIEFPIS